MIEVIDEKGVLLIEDCVNEFDRGLEVLVLDLFDPQQELPIQMLTEQDLQEDVQRCFEVVVSNYDYVVVV